MNDMILVEKLSKTYTSGKVTAVRDIDLAVTAGSVTAVMGKSGCGKTTLLNLIGGLDAPDSRRYGYFRNAGERAQPFQSGQYRFCFSVL